MDAFIITGANDAYILTLLDFINQYIQQNLEPTNLIVYDLGLSEKNRELVNRINNQLTMCFTIKKLDYTKYPEHVDLKKYKGLYCSYAFKGIIMYNEAQLLCKPLIWMDNANRFNLPVLKNIIDSVNKYGIYSPISTYEKTIETIELNHPKTTEIIGLTEYEHNNLLTSRTGGLVGVDYNSKPGKEIIDNWYKYSLQKEVIMPEGSTRNNHRQDQTVLSLLIFLYEKQNNIKFDTSSFNISYWNKKDPPTINENHFPYKLLDKKDGKQLAIIYAKSLEEAIQIYSNRKKMYISEFINKYVVEKI